LEVGEACGVERGNVAGLVPAIAPGLACGRACGLHARGRTRAPDAESTGDAWGHASVRLVDGLDLPDRVRLPGALGAIGNLARTQHGDWSGADGSIDLMEMRRELAKCGALFLGMRGRTRADERFQARQKRRRAPRWQRQQP